jgi:hypothetical protein
MNRPPKQARSLGTFEADGDTFEVMQVCPVPPGWYAIHGDGAMAIKKPIAVMAVGRWHSGAATSPAFLPVIGWDDTGFELAAGSYWRGVIGPGENAEAFPSVHLDDPGHDH